MFRGFPFPHSFAAARSRFAAEGVLARKFHFIALAATGVAALTAGALAYAYLDHRSRYEALVQLRAYALQRAERESAGFEYAVREVFALRKEFEEDIDRVTDATATFAKYTERCRDGAIRQRHVGFDTGHDSMIFLRRGTVPDPELCRKIVAARDAVTVSGASLHPGMINTYIMLPEAAVAVRWPAMPEWADLENPATGGLREPQWSAATRDNPAARARWTAPHYDNRAGTRLISCVAPVVRAGRVIAVAGIDLPLSMLTLRMTADTLPGATNMMVRHDGALLAHPDFVDALSRPEGPAADTARDALLRALPAPGEPVTVNFSPDGRSAIAAAEIPGASARYVCMMPVADLTRGTRSESLMFASAIGLIIAIHGWLLHRVVRRCLIDPVNAVAHRVDTLAGVPSGTASENAAGGDELNRLARRIEALAGRFTAITPSGVSRGVWSEPERIRYTCRPDAQWTVLRISDAVATLTGHPASAFLDGTRNLETIVHPDDRARVAQTIRTQARHGSGYTVAYRLVRADGGVVSVRETARFVNDVTSGELVIEGVIEQADLADRV